MHTAFRRETGARTTILMVHGIMGSPDQFRFLADAIESRNAESNVQIDYFCVLLPGHGGSVRDFASARAADWKNFIHETVCELRLLHERLIFVGHSMGCLLGLIENECAPLDGMLLISCPLRLRASLRYPIAGARSVLEDHPENPRLGSGKSRQTAYTRETRSNTCASRLRTLSCSGSCVKRAALRETLAALRFSRMTMKLFRRAPPNICPASAFSPRQTAGISCIRPRHRQRSPNRFSNSSNLQRQLILN